MSRRVLLVLYMAGLVWVVTLAYWDAGRPWRTAPAGCDDGVDFGGER